MQTRLAPAYRQTAEGQQAEAILRKCVHCGFCTATCPTYQVLGDELDSPRGRIWLIKEVLEGQQPTRSTQRHLDRCLTCRSCETTCPSGVQYGRLLDTGRHLVAQKVKRPPLQRAVRWALRHGLTSRLGLSLFGVVLKLGQRMRGVLPETIRRKIPALQSGKQRGGKSSQRWPQRQQRRKVLLLAGCVQPHMAPNINAATARVLDAAGIQTVVAQNAACCGALKFHLDDVPGAKRHMRANMQAWWPYVQSGDVEALVMNASGCGVMVKDYAHIFKDEADWAEKARRISALTRDVSELLPEMAARFQEKLRQGKLHPRQGIIAYHAPCTLQHGQQLRGGVQTHLRALGFDVRVAASESHLCCGSAGTYSMLQPGLAMTLRERKLAHLCALQPSVIASANIGCISHLQAGSNISVRHWMELLDEALGHAKTG